MRVWATTQKLYDGGGGYGEQPYSPLVHFTKPRKRVAQEERMDGMIEYDQFGRAMPAQNRLCSCGCGEPHNGETYKVWEATGAVYWFKHGAYPHPQSHVVKWLQNRVKDGVP